MMLRVAMTVPHTRAEGPGLRYALWVQGCPFRCPGCCNPEFLEVDGAASERSATDVLAEIAAAKARYGLEGISLLGGEPMLQAQALSVVAQGAQAMELSVMIFSGFTLDELKGRGNRPAPACAAELLAHTDLLVDGRYVEKLRTTTRTFIGSENQGLHFLTDRYNPDDARLHAPNTVELRMVGGKIVLNGFPFDGTHSLVGK